MSQASPAHTGYLKQKKGLKKNQTLNRFSEIFFKNRELKRKNSIDESSIKTLCGELVHEAALMY